MTIESVPARCGHVCWIDLAARDAERAADFYRDLFDWRVDHERLGGGTLRRLSRDGVDVGSLYQLGARPLMAGAPSHWTPYVAVADLAAACQRAGELGGRVLVRAFEVPGVARVGLVLDPVGAMIGLWESPPSGG
ncbi:VOC family protein [Billgrantia azerbaijanica]|nr:VOC family protein [Halomonas azerbaijanica]